MIDPGHYFLNSGEPEGFCRYGYTSLPQSSAQGENRLCSQRWGWRGSASGLGMAGGCCSDLLFASGYFTPHTFREQRTVPCFSCLLNVTEMTKKRKDAWKLENPEIRQDYITLSWWKPMNSDSLSLRGERDLSDEKSLGWAPACWPVWMHLWFNTRAKSSIRLPWDFPGQGKHGGSCGIFSWSLLPVLLCYLSMQSKLTRLLPQGAYTLLHICPQQQCLNSQTYFFENTVE